jgi:ArsR family transcriptional regulator
MRRIPLDCDTPLAGTSLGDADAIELERLFAAIADRRRIKIVNMLARAGSQPVCVCEFTAALSLSQPNVSYHLRQLVEAGVITRRRRGRYSYYALVDGALEHLALLVAPAASDEAAA